MEKATLSLPSIIIVATVMNIHIKDIFPKSAGGRTLVYRARIPKLVNAFIAWLKEKKLKAFIK
jgi:hypothetical protein